MEYLIQFADTENPTWDYLPVGYWSAVETHVGVIVACLPAIRSLQRAIRDRIWPKPPNSTGYFTKGTGNSGMDSAAKSRKWSSKQGISRLSTLNRSRADKEDFVRLDELELNERNNKDRAALNDDRIFQTSFERSLVRSPSPVPHFLTSAISNTHGSQPLDGILVQTEYSVDRGSSYSGHPQQNLDRLENRQFGPRGEQIPDRYA